MAPAFVLSQKFLTLTGMRPEGKIQAQVPQPGRLQIFVQNAVETPSTQGRRRGHPEEIYKTRTEEEEAVDIAVIWSLISPSMQNHWRKDLGAVSANILATSLLERPQHSHLGFPTFGAHFGSLHTRDDRILGYIYIKTYGESSLKGNARIPLPPKSVTQALQAAIETRSDEDIERVGKPS